MLGVIQFENVGHVWLWLLMLVAGGWILWTTYRGIRQRSGRRLSWGLMALRGAGLAALLLAVAKPTWTRQNDLVDPGRVAIVLDNSLSMSLADPSGQPRFALAKAAVERLQEKLSGGPGPRLAVDVLDLEGKLLSDLPAEPRLERTDLARAITGAAAALRSKLLLGVVLVSDGLDNTGRQEFQELADNRVPVYTIGFAPDTEAGRLDLAVRNVQAPARVIKNNDVRVEVLVTKESGPAVEAEVAIKRGADPLVAEKIALPAGNAEQTVSLKIKPAQAGRFVYTAAVASAAGERMLSNNARHFPLQVDADAIKVFYIEGFLRYEYKFLKNRLEDDPDVSLVSVVRRASPEAAGTVADLITAERLKAFEVVILGDMEANYLTDAEYQALIRWIDEGHALLVLGGYHSFGPDGFRKTPLAGVLPVVFADAPPVQSEEPFTLQLTERGKAHPVFEVSGDRVKDAALWAAAPPLAGCSVVQRAKPGADVLAVNPALNVDNAPAVVAAAERYGAGHTMVLTADTTWRWSRLTRVLGQSDTLFARFWSQTLRWLAGRKVDQDRPPLVVSTDQPAYQVGKPVVIRAVRQAGAAQNPAASPGTGDVRVEVIDEQGRLVTVPVQSNSGEPDVFSGTFYPTAGGRYQVLATLAGPSGASANERTEFLVHGSDLEFANPGTSPEQLRTISALTGGAYYPVESADELADKVERRQRRISRVERTEYWNSPALFLFFLAAVTAEWVIRRRNHLV